MFLGFASTGGDHSLWQELLTFVQSAATLLGQGLLRLINALLPESRALGEELVAPLGYLGLLTLVLLLFNLFSAARGVIWFIVGIGWILLIVRIVLAILGIH